MDGQFAYQRQKNNKRRPLLKTSLLVISLAALVGAVFLLFNDKVQAPKNQEQNQTVSAEAKTQEPKNFKTFTGQEFSNLYNSFVYPNTQLINETTPITVNEATDKRIRQIALERGYKLRSAPVTNTFVEVQKDMQLQERAAKPWLDMQAKAKGDGINLKLNAAYRSADDQRTIFLSRLKDISLSKIAKGELDNEINEILSTTALPGYSRHHTGYTIDIGCENDPAISFKKTPCFNWLSKNNYINVKTFGWIPSYPDGAGKQGPEPESWEYVWVGTKVLQN